MKQKLLGVTCLLWFIFLRGQDFQELPHISSDSTNAEMTVQLDSLIKLVHGEYYKNNFIAVLGYGDAGVILAKKLKVKDHEFKIYRYIGSALAKINDTIRAKKVFQNTLEEATKVNDSNTIANSMVDLGNVYNQEGNKDKAILLYNKALPLVKKKSNKNSLFVLSFNLSELYLDRKDIENSKIHIDQMNALIDDVQVPFLESALTLSIGRLLLLREKPDQAIDYFKKNIAIAEAENFMDGILDGYKYYMEALEMQKKYKELHFVRQKFDQYKDEKIEIEKAAAIEAVTAKMNLDQYKQELKAKELENELNQQKAYRSKIFLYFFIGASAILAIFFLFLLVSFRNRKKLVSDLKEKNKQYLIAKEKSEELSQAKSKFLSTISHELRTPLYGIIGFSSLLMDDIELEQYKEDIRSLKFSADYLLSLINDLLQLNKLDAVKHNELELQLFKPKVLIDNIINSFEFMRTQNNNSFNIQIDDAIPKTLKGDHLKLSQILMNLIGNACKFTEDGIITVEVKIQKMDTEYIDLSFCVSDTGVGISEEKQRTIFDEFIQDSNRTNFEGTGLGLAIVKKLIDIQKGTITLKSTPNQGTEFKFLIGYLIPKVEEHQEVSVPDNEIFLEDKHILIVDDNRINQIVTRKILERNKYSCTVVDNGQKAIDIFKKQNFDLILMDVNMPIMNGVEATKIIRKFNTDIPIIALTAIDVDKLDEDVSSIGVSDIIIKPYDITVFLETLQQNLISVK